MPAKATFTLNHLQAVCRHKKLPVSGLKKDVVSRISKVMTLDELKVFPCGGAGSKEDDDIKGGPMC